MRIALTDRFQRDARRLTAEQRTVLFEVILALPQAIGETHRHSGLGLRKIHRSGVWEARIGLGLRMVFGIETGTCILDRIGSHDEIKRYLRSL